MSHETAQPRLLVSVRSVEEARAALVGGADIIDVKEPSRGSLGRADADVIAAIASLPDFADRRTPLSVALGEVQEADRTDIMTLPQNVTFAKLGLAGLGMDENWIVRWTNIRREYERSAASPIGWIAVIYADAARAKSPPALATIAAAAATGCVGVLVDTHFKTGDRLLDHVSRTTLEEWVHGARSHGLLFAAAGQVMVDELPQLSPVALDVIGVRSAVCEENDRRGSVCPVRVCDFKRAMNLMSEELTTTSN